VVPATVNVPLLPVGVAAGLGEATALADGMGVAMAIALALPVTEAHGEAVAPAAEHPATATTTARLETTPASLGRRKPPVLVRIIRPRPSIPATYRSLPYFVYPYSFRLASCSAWVLAKALVPLPSFFARK
jgi:hypothetical protein